MLLELSLLMLFPSHSKISDIFIIIDVDWDLMNESVNKKSNLLVTISN